MSVNIPVSADSSQAVAAIEKIRQAIKSAGQEGKAFTDLDFSHPELTGVASELQEVQRRFEQVRNARGSTGQGVRKTGASNFLDWYENHEAAFAGSPGAARRHVDNVGGYITSGTSFAPAPPAGTVPPPGAAAGAAPPPPPAGLTAGDPLLPGGYGRGGGGNGGSGGAIGGAYSMVKGALGALPAPIKFALGAAGIDGIGRMAGRAVGQAEDEAIGDDKLMRQLDGLGTDFETLRDAVRKTGDALHVTYGETQRLASLYGRMSGSTNAADVLDQTRFAAGVARGYGLDAGSFVGAAGRMAQGGVDPKEFAGLLGDTIRDGMTGGQVEQTMNALVRWTETTNRALVDHSNVSDFAATLGLLNNTQLPGLRGENGVNLLGQVDQAVKRGGAGGQASEALTYRAMYGAGIKDPYDIQYRLEGGMFERGPNGSGRTNFQILYDQFNKDYAGVYGPQRREAGARMFGVSQHQFEALEKAHVSGASPGEGMNFLNEHKISLDSLDPNSLNEVFQVLHADDKGLESWRAKLGDQHHVATQKGAAALAGKSGDELREGLVRLLGDKGMSQTMGSQAQDSIASFSNALTQAGTGLIPAVSALRDGVALVTQEFIGPLSTALGDFTQWLRDQAGAAVDNLLTPDPNNPDAAGGGAGASGGKGFFRRFGEGALGLMGIGGGDRTKLTTDQQKAAGTKLGIYLESLGLDNAHASAMVARAQLESGFDAKSDHIDTDGLRHRGLWQLSPHRQANFEAWAKKPFDQATWQDQAAFGVYEMTGGEEKDNATAFWKARTAKDGGQHFSADVIRPGNKAYEALTTGDTAEGWSHLLPGGATPGAAAGATPDPATAGAKPGAGGADTSTLHLYLHQPGGAVDHHEVPLTGAAPAAPYGGAPGAAGAQQPASPATPARRPSSPAAAPRMVPGRPYIDAGTV